MISVEGLSKQYEARGSESGKAVDGISFANETGRFLTLLGPSGCGKSTTLRCIAGLETPDAGEIEVGGRTVFSSTRRINVPSAKRKIGMVFQSYAIWPHMTVMENVAYPLRFQDVPSKRRRERTHEILEIVGLGGFADRPAPYLSGGQQQRVALARALVSEPEVLLFDEPLSNLDAALRRELGTYIRTLQQRLGLTVVYVTHDQGEALSMSDEIALMNLGVIVDRTDPLTMYRRPGSEFAASFLGDANLFVVLDTGSDGDRPVVHTADGTMVIADDSVPEIDRSMDDGGMKLMIRPEHIRISANSLEDLSNASWNVLSGTIVARRYYGSRWEYVVQTTGGIEVIVKQFGEDAALEYGPAYLAAPRWACVLVAGQTRKQGATTEGEYVEVTPTGSEPGNSEISELANPWPIPDSGAQT